MILSCSPRLGGNCDDAAEIVSKAAELERTSAPFPIVQMRDHAILPCTSCGWCRVHPGQCPLADSDQSLALFSRLQSTTKLVIVAPIYFYHLPAQLKAFIDRSQSYWNPRGPMLVAGASPKKAYIILIAGRERGENLFKGSLLTCRYWLDVFGFDLAEPYLIYGADDRGALKGRSAAEPLAAYARSVFR